MESYISGHTKLVCLLGNPVAHSISPKIQNTAFDMLNLDCKYLAFNVNADQLKQAVEGLRAVGAVGFNVTMPHKNQMAQLVDELSPAARICGAVNTVVNENGKFVGYTTDGVGYIMSARAEGVEIAGKRLVQLGAGGAGTATLVQAAMDGASQIDVFNPRDAFWTRVEQIAGELNRSTKCTVVLHDISDLNGLKTCLSTADLLLNTTPVGMEKLPGCLIPDPSYFHPGLVVSDIIYEPAETQLLKMAREAGLKTFNGMYMLLYQGAASFALWTGKEMPVQEIKKLIFIKH